MYMIFNLGGNNDNVQVKAEEVLYNDSNVDAALGILENELTANGKRIYLDYKDGKYGYNTSAGRGADTFIPFKSDDEYTNLTTVSSITGDNLPTITGSGYISIKRINSMNDTNVLKIYIDSNTEPFELGFKDNQTGVRGDYFRAYFQESIRFGGAKGNETYFYQTLLSDKPVGKKYNIIQGRTNSTDYITFTGKGKILISPSQGEPLMYYRIDNVAENSIQFCGHQYMEFIFNTRFIFKIYSHLYPLYYIAYTEI